MEIVDGKGVRSNGKDSAVSGGGSAAVDALVGKGIGRYEREAGVSREDKQGFIRYGP